MQLKDESKLNGMSFNAASRMKEQFFEVTPILTQEKMSKVWPQVSVNVIPVLP
jgi:hypothetical protein